MLSFNEQMVALKKNPQFMKNVKLLWSKTIKDPLFKKYLMENYLEHDPKLSKKVVNAIISAGFPKQMVSNLTGYYVEEPPSADTYLHDMVMYMTDSTEKFLSGDITEALSNLAAALQEIDEEQIEALEAAAEAPARAPLGRIAFAPHRLEKSVPKTEVDTDREHDLYRALERHIDFNTKLTKDDTDFIKSLMKKGYYQNMFKPPEVERLYRGMNIPARWLRKILGLGPNDPIRPKGSADVSFRYRPRSGNATSWTKSKKVSRGFGGIGMYSVVFTAFTSDNPNSFLDLNGGIYNVDPFHDMAGEKEIIGMGPIRVSKVEWVLL